MLLLDFKLASNTLIDCPVSIVVEIAIARMMRAFSCLLSAEPFVFMVNSKRNEICLLYAWKSRCHIQTNYIAYIAILSEKDYYFSDRIIFLY